MSTRNRPEYYAEEAGVTMPKRSGAPDSSGGRGSGLPGLKGPGVRREIGHLIVGEDVALEERHASLSRPDDVGDLFRGLGRGGEAAARSGSPFTMADSAGPAEEVASAGGVPLVDRSPAGRHSHDQDGARHGDGV